MLYGREVCCCAAAQLAGSLLTYDLGRSQVESESKQANQKLVDLLVTYAIMVGVFNEECFVTFSVSIAQYFSMYFTVVTCVTSTTNYQLIYEMFSTHTTSNFNELVFLESTRSTLVHIYTGYLCKVF